MLLKKKKNKKNLISGHNSILVGQCVVRAGTSFMLCQLYFRPGNHRALHHSQQHALQIEKQSVTASSNVMTAWSFDIRHHSSLRNGYIF